MVNPKILKFSKGKLRNYEQVGDDLIVIGRILKAIGLKGWLRVNLLTDYPDRFAEGETVTLRRRDASLESFEIVQMKEHFTATRVDVLFDGISTRDEASRLLSCFVVIDKSERAELPKDSFYNDELEGMTVISGGVNVGSVVRLESDVPSPYISIDTDMHGAVMVPFRKEFIEEISRSERKIVLRHDITFHIPV